MLNLVGEADPSGASGEQRSNASIPNCEVVSKREKRESGGKDAGTRDKVVTPKVRYKRIGTSAPSKSVVQSRTSFPQ